MSNGSGFSPRDYDLVKYETVAVSQTAQIMGGTGAVGDIFIRLIAIVSTSGANGTCSIVDGNGTAISIIPASAPIGVHVVELGIKSVNATTPGWKVTTGSACTAVGIGIFS